MKFMRYNLLNKSTVSSIIGIFLLVGTAFAQMPNQKTRRNSPFAPNPRGRTEIAKAADSELQNNLTAQKVMKTELPVLKNEEPTVGKTEVTATVENQSAGINGSGEADVPTPSAGDAYSETFPVMKKDAEIAKKASVSTAPSDIYKVGIGDILYISLQNVPAKESTYFTVLKDGTIDYPLAGEMVAVDGMTADEIEARLQEKIKLYEKPQVSVKVREHNSHHYTVLGMVEKPGEKPLEREAYPLLVVRAEAVVEPKADQATIKRSNSQVETVDLKDPKSDEILIYSGDVVEFTSPESASDSVKKFFYIGGEILDGGQKDYLAGMTLTQAILASGGLKKQSVKKVVIRRKNEAGMLSSNNYDLKAIKDGKSADPEIKSGDTIEIGN